MRNTYGSLADQPNFQRAFSRWLLMIWDLGVEAALASYCDNKVPAQHGEGQV
jgi:hypothetical protein